MSLFAAICQIVIALGIINVWVVRRNRATPYRPDGARNITEEFQRYGLPDWAPTAVGGTKLALAGALVFGLVYTPIAPVAAGLMSLLMVGAIVAHLRVRDPLMRAVPAMSMLALSMIVVVSYVG